jgi:hypothetical protein
MNVHNKIVADSAARRSFSDARFTICDDEAALLRLWRRREVEPQVPSANLTIQLNVVD